MDRRKFITNTGLAATAISVGSVSCVAVANDQKQNVELDVVPDDFLLNEITITALQEKMERGELTSEKITQLYLDRIEKIDRNGPRSEIRPL